MTPVRRLSFFPDAFVALFWFVHRLNHYLWQVYIQNTAAYVHDVRIPENTQHWPYLTISFSFQNCSRIAILPLHSQGAVPSSKSSGSPQLPSKRVEFTFDDTKEDLKAETIESSRTRYTRLPLASPTIFPANCFQNLRDTFWFHRSL